MEATMSLTDACESVMKKNIKASKTVRIKSSNNKSLPQERWDSATASTRQAQVQSREAVRGKQIEHQGPWYFSVVYRQNLSLGSVALLWEMMCNLMENSLLHDSVQGGMKGDAYKYGDLDDARGDDGCSSMRIDTCFWIFPNKLQSCMLCAFLTIPTFKNMSI